MMKSRSRLPRRWQGAILFAAGLGTCLGATQPGWSFLLYPGVTLLGLGYLRVVDWAQGRSDS